MLITLLFSLVFFNFAIMNIENHISQLLYRFQCVTVPGFGAFLSETISAKINENTLNFNPPSKVLSFNGNLKNNDGLLANHIAVTEKITYNQAVLAINTAIDIWKNELDMKRFLLIKNIGDFTLNSENNLVFNPSNHINYLTTSFGLGSFISPTIKREVVANIEEKLIEKAIYPFEKEPKQEVIFEEEDEQPRRYLNTYLKYAAVLIMSCGVGSFGYKSYINKEEQNEIRIVQADVQKEITAKIQEATFFISAPISNNSDVVATPKKLSFHIMAGAFRNEKNANKQLKYLLKKGFAAKILSQNASGLYPVIYSSFTTYSEAQDNLIKIQNTQNKEAWLLIKDL